MSLPVDSGESQFIGEFDLALQSINQTEQQPPDTNTTTHVPPAPPMAVRPAMGVRRYSLTTFSNEHVHNLAVDIMGLLDSNRKGFCTQAEYVNIFEQARVQNFSSESRVRSTTIVEMNPGQPPSIPGVRPEVYRQTSLRITLPKAIPVEESFIIALGKVLSNREGVLTTDSLEEAIAVLHIGELHDRVNLLVKFLDRDGDGAVSLADLDEYLPIQDHKLAKKLGLIDKITHKRKTMLTSDDLLELFQESSHGGEAIDIFCNLILSTLISCVPESIRGHMQPSLSFRERRDSTLQSNLEPIFHEVIQWFRKQSNIYYLLFTALQVFLFLYNFFMYYRIGSVIPLCFAKGFGLNLRVLTSFIYLTMCRTVLGYFYSQRLVRPIVPLGINIELHSFLGFSILFHSFGHLFAHLGFQTEHVPRGMNHGFDMPMVLTGANWENKGSGDNITGVILTVIIFLMGASALLRSYGSRMYAIFSYTHYLYLLWIPFIILHVPKLWNWYVPITGIIILERVYDLFHNTTIATLELSRPCANGVTYLSLPKPAAPVQYGTYYRIRIPALSMEWHPFSVAGANNSHRLTFFIASLGDWTRRLHKMVSNPELRKSWVQVQGPFITPASTALEDDVPMTLLVASGIGITPFFSVVASKVNDEHNYQTDRLVFRDLFYENIDSRAAKRAKREQKYGTVVNNESGIQLGEYKKVSRDSAGGDSSDSDNDTPNTAPATPPFDGEVNISDLESGIPLENLTGIIRVVWVIRNVTELVFYLDYLHHLVKLQADLARPIVFVEIYLTGLGSKSEPKHLLGQMLFLLTLTRNNSNFLQIHFGRPDMSGIINVNKPQKVYYCGGKILMTHLEELCTDQNIDFYPESFDADAYFIRNTVDGMKRMCRSLKTPVIKKTTVDKIQETSVTKPTEETTATV